MSLRKALLAATVLSLPIAAQAQPISGLYVGAGAGYNYRQDATINNLRPINRASFEAGFAAVGSVGWGFGNGFRVEGEGNYRYNDVHRFRAGGLAVSGSSGNLRSYGFMANALYDFDLTSFGISPRTFSPYVGVGVGYVQNQAQRVSARVLNNGVTTRYALNDSTGTFGYQGIVGGAFGLGDLVPGLALTLEYRFLGSLEPQFSGGTATVGNVTTTTSNNIRVSNYNHSALLGLRYAFNTPRPPVVAQPPVVVAPPVARTYLVFFDWNRADLTDRARQIIAEAATGRNTVRSTRIEVSGHADTSGSAAYNQTLSMRRAEAVAAELVRRGVPRSEMVIQAFGETRPLVATGDNVREPQNRRVEIVLR